MTPLTVIDEARLTLARDSLPLILDSLAVDDLHVDVLAGTPFLIAKEITVRPSVTDMNLGL